MCNKARFTSQDHIQLNSPDTLNTDYITRLHALHILDMNTYVVFFYVLGLLIFNQYLWNGELQKVLCIKCMH